MQTYHIEGPEGIKCPVVVEHDDNVEVNNQLGQMLFLAKKLQAALITFSGTDVNGRNKDKLAEAEDYFIEHTKKYLSTQVL